MLFSISTLDLVVEKKAKWSAISMQVALALFLWRVGRDFDNLMPKVREMSLDLASSVQDFWQRTVVGIFGDISRREMLLLSTQWTLLPTSAPCEPRWHPIHTRRHLRDASTDDDHSNDKNCGSLYIKTTGKQGEFTVEKIYHHNDLTTSAL